MNLAQIVTNLNIQTQPGQCWAVLGPEAEAFGVKLHPAQLFDQLDPDLDGLLLARVLSSQVEAASWLEQVVTSLKDEAVLVVIDWQYEGPPNYGPDLEWRFKRGKLCRLLRESGFGLVETLDSQPVYYVVRAVKGPLSPRPHAGEFVVVAELGELSKNAMKRVELFGHKIIVANTGKEIVAFARACPHDNAPLDKGILRGRNIVCPSHAYIWNVHTGAPVEPADEDILPRYPVKVDADRGQILVALEAPTLNRQ